MAGQPGRVGTACEQPVETVRGSVGVPGSEHLPQQEGGLAQLGEIGRGDLDGLGFAVVLQYRDQRGLSAGASRAGEQHGEQVRGALRGRVHAAAEHGLLTGHD